MIDSIKGQIIHKSPTYLRIDVNGIGYGINIPLSTYNSLDEIGQGITLFTYLYVREDILRLYGFKTEEEIDTFKLLLSVTKVGPQLALGILSSLSVLELKEAIINEDITRLNNVPGVGKKTAQRIIIELKEKISPIDEILLPAKGLDEKTTFLIEEGVRGLMSLGCSKKEALKAIKSAYDKLKDKKPSLEELVKYALNQL